MYSALEASGPNTQPLHLPHHHLAPTSSASSSPSEHNRQQILNNNKFMVGSNSSSPPHNIYLNSIEAVNNSDSYVNNPPGSHSYGHHLVNIQEQQSNNSMSAETATAEARLTLQGFSNFPPSPSSDSHSESPTTPNILQNGSNNSSGNQYGHLIHASKTSEDIVSLSSLRQPKKESHRNEQCLTPPHSASKELSDYTSLANASERLPSASTILRPDTSLSPLPSTQFSYSNHAAQAMASFGSIKFNSEQIDCICDSLQQRGETKRLENFLHSYHLDNSRTASEGENDCGLNRNEPSEAVMRARAFAAFEGGNYRELYSILESRDFSSKYHSTLQEMWYKAHYKEAESVRGRSLGKNNSFSYTIIL